MREKTKERRENIEFIDGRLANFAARIGFEGKHRQLHLGFIEDAIVYQ